jgi:hypothetical protein
LSVDLSKLTKAQKLEMLDLLERKGALKRERRDSYEPHDGQLSVHRSRADERFVFAGNGSGKTALGVNEVIWAVQGYNPVLKEHTPVPSRVFVVLDKPEKVESVILPELRKWVNIKPDQLHKRGKPYISHITVDNGSTITFLFFDQDPLTAEGLEMDFVWIDEPCPRNLFVSLKRGGRTKGRRARYLLTGTPIAAPWLRQDIYEKWVAGELPNAECFRFGTESNKQNLDDGYIERFSAYLTEKERRIRLEGEFFDLDGLALAHLFKRSTHVIPKFDWPEQWQVVVGLDFHPSKPNVAVMLGVDRHDNLYYIKEMQKKAVAKDFVADLKAFMAGYRVIDIVCDSLGSSETSGGNGFDSFIKVLRDHGIPVRPTTYEDKNDEAFIDRITSALAIPEEPNQFGERHPKLRILEGNPGIVADCENVAWTKVRYMDVFKPKLDISNKDRLAALKYCLACNLHSDSSSGKMFVRRKPVTAYGQAAKSGRMRFRRPS